MFERDQKGQRYVRKLVHCSPTEEVGVQKNISEVIHTIFGFDYEYFHKATACCTVKNRVANCKSLFTCLLKFSELQSRHEEIWDRSCIWQGIWCTVPHCTSWSIMWLIVRQVLYCRLISIILINYIFRITLVDILTLFQQFILTLTCGLSFSRDTLTDYYRQ